MIKTQNEYDENIKRAKLFYEEGNYYSAAELFQRVLDYAIEKKLDSIPLIYTFLGSAYDESGNFPDAEINYKKALKIAEETHNQYSQASCLCNLSIVYFHMNDYENSLQCLKIAEYILSGIKDYNLLVQLYLQYSNVYSALGKKIEEEEYLIKSFDSMIQNIFLIEIKGLYLLHKTATFFYLQKGDNKEAQSYFQITEAFEKFLKNKNSLAITKMNIGIIFFKQKQFSKSISFFLEALNIFNELKNKLELGWCRLYLGKVYRILENEKDALILLEESLKIAEKILDLRLKREVTKELGFLCYQKDKKMSYKYASQSIETLRQERGKLTDFNLNLGFSSTNSFFDSFNLMIKLCYELDKKEEAFEILEQYKSYSFRNLLKNSKIKPNTANNEILQKEKELLEKINFHQNHKIKYGKENENNEYEINEYENMKIELDKIYEKIESIDPKYVNLRKGITVTFKKVKEIVMEKDIIIIEYFTSSATEIFIFVITKNDYHIKIVNLPCSLFKYYESFHNKVVHLHTTKSTIRWTELADYLLEPIKNYIEQNKLICFIPSGLLYSIPLHILQLNHKLLIERNPVIYCESSSLIPYYYNNGSNRMETCSAFALSDKEYYFEKEAEEVSRIFESKHIMDIKKNDLYQYLNNDILHFATHGVIDKNPFDSNITLNKEENLTVKDIFELSINAELVTLSACDTGINHFVNGDEMIGLMHSFFYAGAGSLLVSLWPVSDEATFDLMKIFYRNIKNGMNKPNALQNAIIETKKIHDHIRSYGAFILVGKI